LRAVGPKKRITPDTAKKRTERPSTAARKKRSSGTPTMPLPMATTLNGVGSTEHSSASAQKFCPSSSPNVASMPKRVMRMFRSMLRKLAAPSCTR
jgi:hypothetical protein